MYIIWIHTFNIKNNRGNEDYDENEIKFCSEIECVA